MKPVAALRKSLKSILQIFLLINKPTYIKAGAVAQDGTTEAEINLKIALKLQNLLEQS